MHSSKYCFQIICFHYLSIPNCGRKRESLSNTTLSIFFFDGETKWWNNDSLLVNKEWIVFFQPLWLESILKPLGLSTADIFISVSVCFINCNDDHIKTANHILLLCTFQTNQVAFPDHYATVKLFLELVLLQVLLIFNGYTGPVFLQSHCKMDSEAICIGIIQAQEWTIIISSIHLLLVS